MPVQLCPPGDDVDHEGLLPRPFLHAIEGLFEEEFFRQCGAVDRRIVAVSDVPDGRQALCGQTIYGLPPFS